jgi:hypothetical protein
MPQIAFDLAPVEDNELSVPTVRITLREGPFHYTLYADVFLLGDMRKVGAFTFNVEHGCLWLNVLDAGHEIMARRQICRITGGKDHVDF